MKRRQKDGQLIKMGRLKLLECSTVSSTITAFLLPLLNAAKKAGFCVSVACRLSEGTTDGLRIHPVYDIPFSRRPLAPDNLRAFFMLRKLMIREKFDIVHLHTPVAAFIGRMAAASLGRHRPYVVYTAHGLHFQGNGRNVLERVYRLAECLAAHWTDVIVVMNDEDEASARLLGLGKRVVRIDGVGVDPEYYSPRRFDVRARSLWRRKHGFRDGTPLILMIAEMNPGKRHIDAIRAMPKIRANHPEAILLLVGEGRLRPTLEREVARSGLSEAIKFLGVRTDIPQLLAASDVLILPSVREGLPRVILEAMSMEKPVVGCDVRGIRDLLGQGAGRLVRVHDQDGLAREINELLANPAVGRTMGAVGRTQILQRYALPWILDCYTQLFTGLINRIPENSTLGQE